MKMLKWYKILAVIYGDPNLLTHGNVCSDTSVQSGCYTEKVQEKDDGTQLHPHRRADTSHVR